MCLGENYLVHIVRLSRRCFSCHLSPANGGMARIGFRAFRTGLMGCPSLPYFSSMVLSIAALTSPQLPRPVPQSEQVTALTSVALHGIASSLLPHFSQGKAKFNSPMGILSIQVRGSPESSQFSVPAQKIHRWQRAGLVNPIHPVSCYIPPSTQNPSSNLTAIVLPSKVTLTCPVFLSHL